MKRAIQCKYSCFLCGVTRQIITVVAREDEDVKTWLDNTAIVMADHHHLRFPYCENTKLDEVLIPISDDNPKVGGVPD